MTPLQRLVTFAVVIAAFGFASMADAQAPKGQGQRMYDPAKESTLTGTIEAVEKVSHPERAGRRSLGGLHVTLKTNSESIVVHLGPIQFLDEKKLTVAKGDAVEIVGSRVTIDDEPVLLARTVKKRDKTWTLRDESGTPLWSGGRR